MTIVASESEIRAAIERIRSSPGTFQRLAEDFMCIKFGGPYVSLCPQGRKPNDQTIKGYPDAYAKLPDGRLLVVEITAGDWRTHLEADLVKLKKLANTGIAEISFFTMQDADTLLPQSNANKTKPKRTVQYFRDELHLLGIPKEGIRFYFINEIVKELRETQYAKILYSLKLPVTVTPFENIDLLPYPNMGPTLEEYKSKQIAPKRRLNKVKRCIDSHPITIITGNSGVGKTTLALAVAHQWADAKNRTAMYVNFGDTPDPSVLVEKIITLVKVFGDRNTLFIIDNTHLLNASLLAQIENTFHRAENEPKLLMISHLTPSHHHSTREKQTKNAIISLLLGASDIEAAYKFICRRITNSPGFYKPKKVDLSEWILFAPDMVTFCMALTNEKENIISGLRPSLSLDGTRDFINDNYIKYCSLEERKILAIVATLATHEMVTSELSLPTRPNQELLQLGLITKTSTKDGSYARYKLAHDKLGRLILEALKEDPVALLEETFQRDPFQASFWVRRQLDRERQDFSQIGKAAAVLRKIDNTLWHFTKDFSPNYVSPIANMYEEALVPQTFWEVLPQRLNTYIDSNDNFLKGIPSYLALGADRPELEQACWNKLEQQNIANRFSTACQRASAKSLGALLSYAEKRGQGTLNWIVPAMTSKPIAIAMANRLSLLDPHPAEMTLSTLQRVAPKLFNLLKSELRKGELLLPFLHNLRKSSEKNTRLWLERPILLELALQKDTESSVAISFATRRIRSLRALIECKNRTLEIDKLINTSVNFILSDSNTKKPTRYTRSQLTLIMEHYADSRKHECNDFVMELYTSGRLDSVINSMKPDALHTIWSATQHFRTNSRSRTVIREAILGLLEKRLNRMPGPKNDILQKLTELSTLVG
jgi:energy-coupling factor transporter ATP-binding protein EcfA2